MEVKGLTIYYSKSQWPDLVKNCLVPLMYSIAKTDWITDYMINVAFNSGDHVKIILFSNNNNDFIVRYVKKKVKFWIKYNKPRRRLVECLDADKLWMNFSTNSVHNRITHNLIYKYFNDANRFKAFKSMSNQVVSYIYNESEELDTSSLISRAVMLCIIAATNSAPSKCIIQLTKLIDLTNNLSEIAESGEFSMATILDDFEVNAEYLVDFYYSCVNKDSLDQDTIEWQFCAKNYITTSALSKEEAISELLDIVNLYFGFGPAIQIYVLIFVRQVLILVDEKQGIHNNARESPV